MFRRYTIVCWSYFKTCTLWNDWTFHPYFFKSCESEKWSKWWIWLCVIEYFLESIKEDSIQDKPTEMPHLETHGSLNYNSRNGISEHFIYPNYMGTHNMNVVSDRAGWLEDDILEDPLEDVDKKFSWRRMWLLIHWKNNLMFFPLEFNPISLRDIWRRRVEGKN